MRRSRRFACAAEESATAATKASSAALMNRSHATASRRSGLCSREETAASRRPPALEPESHIEGLGLGVECVDDDRMNSELLRKVERSRHGVAKEISAQASAMNALVDSEAREENDWHGVSWKLFGLVCGQALRLDLATGQGVVTENSLIISRNGDISPSQIAPLVLADKHLQEVVDSRATVEALPHVPAVSRLLATQPRFLAFPAIRRFSAAFGFGG